MVSQRRVMWFALPWLALSLPLLSALRLRAEFPYDSDAAFAGALALADQGGPYLAVVALWLGLRPAGGGRRRSVLEQGTRPMLALLVVAVVSLALLVPFDGHSTQGPWRRILGWLGAVALPLWSVALLLRVQGAPRSRAMLPALGLVATLLLGSIAVGSLLLLDPWAQLLPVSAAGLVAALGCVLAAWEAVPASPRAVLLAAALCSLGVASLTALRVANPPMDSGWVVHVEAIDPRSGRATVAVRWPNVEPLSMVEIDLTTGRWVKLPSLTRQVRYAGGVRVAARLGRLSNALGRRGPILLCREVDGAPGADRCGPTLPMAPGTLLEPHPREAKLLASWVDRFVIWDLEGGGWTEVRREGQHLRWPCFDAAGGVIWRLQQAEGPYLQERRRPDGTVVSLPLDHDFQCMERSRSAPSARFERGRTRIGKPSVLYSDRLPGGALRIPGVVQLVRWSRDGSTAALHIELDENRHSVRFYRDGDGLSDPVPVEALTNLLVSPNGGQAVWTLSGGMGRLRYEVHRVPDGAILDSGTLDSSAMAWSDDGLLLLHQDGRLLWRDPVSRREHVLFPAL